LPRRISEAQINNRADVIGPWSNSNSSLKGIAFTGDARCGDIMRMRGVMAGLVSINVLCGAALYSAKDPSASQMNFIEKASGFSPDNGDRSMEILVIVALAVFAGAIGLSLRPAK
jgi:hypothetical protein